VDLGASTGVPSGTSVIFSRGNPKVRKRRMKKLLIGFGIVLLVLPVLSSAQDKDYTVNDNSDEANNNTNSVVPEGMEAVNVKGFNLLIPKGAKIDFNGAQLIVEDTTQYMSRKFEEIDMRLKKIERKLEEQDKKNKALKTP